jgi:hypothetical protein
LAVTKIDNALAIGLSLGDECFLSGGGSPGIQSRKSHAAISFHNALAAAFGQKDDLSVVILVQ